MNRRVRLCMLTILLITAIFLLARDVPNDPEHLAATHPLMRQVCDVAGSCGAVYLRRDEGRWVISVPSAARNNLPLGLSYGLGQTVDDAAKDFLEDYHEKQATWLGWYRQEAPR